MDKYEEATYNAATHICIPRSVYDELEKMKWSALSVANFCVPVIIEKARKFDQLVEARKKATPGEWEIGLCHSGEECWCRLVNVKNSDKYVCGEGSINTQNANFITLAANLTREGE